MSITHNGRLASSNQTGGDSLPTEEFSFNFERIKVDCSKAEAPGFGFTADGSGLAKSAPKIAGFTGEGETQEGGLLLPAVQAAREAARSDDQEPEHGADSFVFSSDDDPEAVLIGLLLPAVQKISDDGPDPTDGVTSDGFVDLIGAAGPGAGPHIVADQEPELGFGDIEPEEADLPGVAAGDPGHVEVLSQTWGETDAGVDLF